MKNNKNLLIGFIIVFFTLCFSFGILLFFYTLVESKKFLIKFIVITLVILLTSVIFVVIDTIRKKYTVDKYVEEILSATKKMTKGDFNIKLNPNHSFNNFTTYDLIKNDLNILAIELSKNEILKNDFISNVSHEIKTPLSVIQNYARALENPKLDDETRKKYLVYLQNACKKLSNLINNILKLNKLENQEIFPDYKVFNLSESIINQILQYENLIEDKDLELICNIEENIMINSEESYLELIWNNLISNAIKFTDKGSITIKLKRINKDIIFTIKDTGCGIDKEIGSHIFDKFYQGDSSHNKEGNGLGLALVKKVIDKLGGTISINSEKNVGTEFTVVIKENING